jgi:HAD superfamily hydrolase (TIGR01509 family)
MKIIFVDAVDCIVSPDGELFQKMYDLLETYPNKKIILTGANDEQFLKFGLDKMPYEVFTLKHNPEKTDPLYFEKLLEQYEITSDDCVYFEHNPEAVKSAESVGIKSYFYDNEIKDLGALQDFLNTHTI